MLDFMFIWEVGLFCMLDMLFFCDGCVVEGIFLGGGGGFVGMEWVFFFDKVFGDLVWNFEELDWYGFFFWGDIMWELVEFGVGGLDEGGVVSFDDGGDIFMFLYWCGMWL